MALQALLEVEVASLAHPECGELLGDGGREPGYERGEVACRAVAPRSQRCFEKLVLVRLPNHGGDAFRRQLGAVIAGHPYEDARAAMADEHVGDWGGEGLARADRVAMIIGLRRRNLDEIAVRQDGRPFEDRSRDVDDVARQAQDEGLRGTTDIGDALCEFGARGLRDVVHDPRHQLVEQDELGLAMQLHPVEEQVCDLAQKLEPALRASFRGELRETFDQHAVFQLRWLG
jgi:hypothetical protein